MKNTAEHTTVKIAYATESPIFALSNIFLHTKLFIIVNKTTFTIPNNMPMMIAIASISVINTVIPTKIMPKYTLMKDKIILAIKRRISMIAFSLDTTFLIKWMKLIYFFK